MIDLKLLSENLELAKNVNLQVYGEDLFRFSEELLRKAVEIGKQTPRPENEYLTPDEVAKILKISLVTLWTWDKKGITNPVYFGSTKRYRKSDIEKNLKDELY